MQEIINFLNDCKVFFIATVDGDTPKVRPFGFVMEFEGKMFFCTAKPKPCCKQMQANPKVEICACNQSMEWVRVCGNVVFSDNAAAKAKCFEVMPMLKQVYKGPENPDFAVFYIDNGSAEFCSMTGAARAVKF